NGERLSLSIPRVLTTSAPGAINIAIQDDNVTKSWEDFDGTLWLTDDDYDCGALKEGSTGQEVAILNCYEPLYTGYVCEGLFPPL
ncbi:uncharacterized protein LOC126980925, partial [Eriocheir sinensis]|uniref:uncharacterized protein LOC126980925 n=1 Tax=Eriocheir sinensis TaxID=95602 RepID=UPI0021C9C3B5